jgi:uncharacterized membrane protein YphA (DoxX/SURF4 family)
MRTFNRVVPIAARLFLGLGFTVFGLNSFLHFMRLPAPPPGAGAGAFLGALGAGGYLFPLLNVTEVVTGLLLLSGLFVPLALAVLAPILVNIIGFHLFLEPSHLLIPLALVAAEIYLAWTYRAAFAPMVRLRTPLPRRTVEPESKALHLAA